MKNKIHKIFIAGLVILLTSICYANDIPLRIISPDQKLVSVIVPLGRDLKSKHIEEDSEYECRIDIYDSKNHRIWSKDFSSTDQDHGRGVAFESWSPDSNFFVFSTVSSGGHHPWQYFTYVFNRQNNAIICLDDLIGPVVQSKFSFSSPDVISLTVWDFNAPNAEAPEPTKKVSAALHKLIQK